MRATSTCAVNHRFGGIGVDLEAAHEVRELAVRRASVIEGAEILQARTHTGSLEHAVAAALV